jgi:hypothetical protein
MAENLDSLAHGPLTKLTLRPLSTCTDVLGVINPYSHLAGLWPERRIARRGTKGTLAKRAQVRTGT